MTAAIRDADSDATGEVPEGLLREMCVRAHALMAKTLPRRLRDALL